MMVTLDVLPACALKVHVYIDNSETLYHVAKALSGSVQFRTSVNGAQCRSLKKAALLKCLKYRNDIYEWALGSHFGSLIDLDRRWDNGHLCSSQVH